MSLRLLLPFIRNMKIDQLFSFNFFYSVKCSSDQQLRMLVFDAEIASPYFDNVNETEKGSASILFAGMETILHSSNMHNVMGIMAVIIIIFLTFRCCHFISQESERLFKL